MTNGEGFAAQPESTHNKDFALTLLLSLDRSVQAAILHRSLEETVILFDIKPS